MLRFVFPFLYIALVIYVIIDLLNSNRSTNQKFFWTMLVIFFPVGGVVLYFLLGSK